VNGVIMNQVFKDVVGGLVAERNEQGAVMGEVILANEVVGEVEKQTLLVIAEQFSDGESKELAGVDLKNKAAIAVL